MYLHRVMFAALLILLFVVPVEAQECGNANGGSTIDIGDISYLLDYLYFGGAPWNWQMDMDDRAGVAHGDVVRIVENLFITYPNGVYDCSPSQTYSFAPSSDDTLFIPRLTSVPDGINSVRMAIKGNLLPGAAGYCVFLGMMPGSNGGFRYISGNFYKANQGFGVIHYWNSDRTLPNAGFAKYTENDILAGAQDLFWIEFGRVTPGSTGADLMLVENQIDEFRRICISRGGDLVVPTIVYYEYQFPPDTLEVSVTSLAFSSAAGKPSRDTLSVTFSSSGGAISFDLSAVDPWVKLLGLPTGSLTTPVTVHVTADALTLPEGIYTSAVQVQNATSMFGVITPQADIPVSFAVGPPINYPPGDVNCNGLVDLTDLSMIIAYLLGFTQSLPVCY
ncbi:MAG: hypothetical protein IPH75_11190 [bacterium]|nr:hypothetical protein [bacterium]